MDRAPTTYEPAYETQEQVSTVNKAFARNLSGILKLCEIILSCIVLICVAAANPWTYYSSGGWVNFVAAITLIVAGLFYIFYLFNVIRRLKGPWIIIEFLALIISTFFWFVAFCVAAANNRFGGGAIASAVFGFVAMVIYITELVTRFRVTKQAGGCRITMTGITAGSPGVPVAATPAQSTKTAPPTNNPQGVGFTGAYAPGEHVDEGYVMP
ncbi:unnamed protein product [Calicophoron daubneyi]|uniref:MARVEL domain-containing protein n=1 Tax=Calicophoron daubneyi TaxID=300641 RepID=A0AAV2T5I9_CALDB